MSHEITKLDHGGEIASTAQTATSMIQVIERAAMNPEVDIDKMERLLAMQERIVGRQAEGEFNRGMAQMQSEIPSITERGKIVVKNETRSHYAKLEDIVDVVRPILQAHGFAISFRVDHVDHGIKVTGIIMHQGGHREETSMTLPFDQSGSKNNVQAMGSSVSYGKRYVLCALLNITTRGQDDDGNSAAPVKTVSLPQAAYLKSLLGKCPPVTQDWFASQYGDTESVPASKYDGMAAKLKAGIEAHRQEEATHE